MRALTAAAVIAAALGLAACGSDDEPGTRVSRDARAVGETVEALEQALARRDFRRVCDRLFSRALRERLGGSRRCAAGLRRAARGVERPSIDVEGISLEGADRARARVVTRAERQAPARDVLVLIRERRGFRVDGLGAMPES